jgi:lipoate-protein ligase B
MLLSTLANFGVLGKQQPGMTGVWILPDEAAEQVGSSQTTKSRPRKIASIGVKVDAHGISRHGFSLNVNPDMSYWEGIIACGLDGFAETSLVEMLSSPPAMESVIDNLIASFGEEFNYRMQRKPL